MTSIITNILSTLRFASSNAGGLIAKHSAAKGALNTGAAPVLQAKTLVYSLAGIALTITSTIIWILLGFITTWFIPIVIAALVAASYGARRIIDTWLATHENGGRKRSWPFRVLYVLVNIIPVFIGAVLKYIVSFIARWAWQLTRLVVFTFFWIYVVERHLNTSINVVSDIWDLGRNVVNIGGMIVDVLLEILNIFLPLHNLSASWSVRTILHVYDGLAYSIDKFGIPPSRRRLDDTLLPETMVHEITVFIQIGMVVASVILELVLIVIDVFFKLGLAFVFTALAQVFQVVCTKLLCGLAGQYCIVLEIIDFIVNYIVLGLIRLLFLALNLQIPLVPIACEAATLHDMGVGSMCAGGIATWEPAGPYRNLQVGGNSNHRRLIECRQSGNSFFEELGGQATHNTTSVFDACPHARAAFHPFGHALNMAKLDVHDCYTMCVGGIHVKACHGTHPKFLGPCDGGGNVTVHQARRKLKTMLDIDTMLSYPESSSLGENPGRVLSRDEVIQNIRALLPGDYFVAGYVSCDLTRPLESVPGIIVDMFCILNRLVDFSKTTAHRRQLLSSSPPHEQTSAIMPVVGDWAHRMRLWTTHTDSYDHPFKYESPLHVAFSQFETLKHRIKNPVVAAEEPRKKREPLQLSRRRRLDSLVPCPEGQRLCANGYQCVVALEECVVEREVSVLGFVDLQIQNGVMFAHTFDIQKAIRREVACWRYIDTHPEADPVAGINIFLPADKLRAKAQFCFPQFAPSEWQFEPFTYSLRNEIEKSCVAHSVSFTNCQCPMHWDLYPVSLPLNNIISEDLSRIYQNALINFKIVWVRVWGDGVGTIWSNLFPIPAYSVEVSRVFSHYSFEIDWDVYWICFGFHIGDTGLLVVTIILAVEFIRVGNEVVLFTLTAMTGSERMKAKWADWLGTNEMWARISDTSGTLDRQYERIEALERLVREMKDRKLVMDNEAFPKFTLQNRQAMKELLEEILKEKDPDGVAFAEDPAATLRKRKTTA